MRDLEKKIDYEFKNKKLLSDSLSHSSIKKFAISFERLEFLGDRILNTIIAEYIYKNFKNNEGDMARMHSAFVCTKACHEIAINLDISKIIKTGGFQLKNNKTVLADAIEALIGAIFLDSNYENTKKIVLNLWENLINKYDDNEQEPKTKLQELTQAKFGEIPVYELISIDGPDHKPLFSVSVSAFGKKASSTGGSRKTAETNAAKKLLEILK